jgi:hypothetical protein
MAREFGVRFLGGVPVDSRWGSLVEEGRRPVYADVRNNRGEEEGEDGEDGRGDGEGPSGVEQDGEGREEGLLVDKYRGCALCGVFEGITRQLVDIVEGQGNRTG